MRKETMIRKVGSKGVILAALFAVPMILTGCVADKFTLSEKPETGKTSIESSVEGRGDIVDSDTEKEERDRRPIYAGSVIDSSFSDALIFDENENPTQNYTFPDSSVYAFEANGYVYYANWKSGETYGYDVKRKELATGKEEDICDVPGIRSVDVYNGFVFVRSYSYDDGKYLERKFDEKTLEEVSNEENNAFFETIGDKSTCSDKRGRESSLDRLMDEVGFLAYYDFAESMVYCKSKGSEEPAIYELENSYEIYAYDKYNMVYSCSVENENDYWAKNLMMLDLNGDATFKIADNFDTFLDYANGVVYYSMRDDSEYGLEEYEVHAYDVTTRVDSVLYKQKKHPGMPIYGPGKAGFTVLNKNIYFLSDDGNEVAWYRIPADSVAKATPERTDFVVSKSNAPKGVKIEGISQTRLCSLCGKPINQVYYEYPVFDLTLYDENVYKKVNEFFKERAVSGAELSLADDSYTSEDPNACEWHGTESGKVTVDYTIFAIRDVKENYMTVEYSGYWYAGGAHGMPLNRFYLIDKRTGDEVTIKDLYKGTEEDFKKLVAEAVIEFSETLSTDESPFFNEGQELFDDAYNGANFDSDIIWNDDSLSVVYPPYELAPYAAGPIEIKISYEDLGIELK